MVWRVDVGRLANKRKTSHGGVRLDATVAVSTVLEYRDPDGSIRREWFPPDEAQKPAWLESLNDAPVTLGHPKGPDGVTGDNRRELSVGHTVASTPKLDGKNVVAELAIWDGKALAAIDSGDLAECSSGYHCKLDASPGVTPDGVPYDFIQRDRIANHTGLGPLGWARAGRDARLHIDGADRVLRLDGNGDVCLHEEKPMKVPFNGETYDLAVPADQVRFELAVARKDEADKATKAERDALQAKLDGQAKDLERQGKELADVKARADAAEVKAAIEDAKLVAPDAKFDGCATVVDVKRAAVAAVKDGGFKVDGAEPGYVLSAYDHLRSKVPAQRVDHARDLKVAVTADPKATRTDGYGAYEAMVAKRQEENRARFERRLDGKTEEA